MANKRIKDLTNTATDADIVSGNYFALDGSAGTKKLNSTTLLTKTAQNALAGNVAPEFVPNSTTTVAGLPYVYNGLMYVAKEAYQGSWDASKFKSVPLSELMYSVGKQSIDLFNFSFSAPLNIFEKSKSSHGYYDGNAGTFVSNINYRVTEKILLEPNTSYMFPFSTSALGNNLRVYLCDENGTINGYIEGVYDDGKLTFVSPPYMTFATLNMGTYTDAQFMLCKTADYPDSHVDFSGYFVKNLVDVDKLRGVIGYSNLTKVMDVSPNMYDNSHVGGIANKFIDANGYSSANNYYISYPIYVQGGVKYKANHSTSALGNNFRYALVDENGDFVSSVSGSNDGGDNNYLVFTPAVSCYIRLNIGISTNLSTFMLAEYDSFPQDYTPYKKEIAPDVGLGEKQKEEVLAIANGTNLTGKILAVNGDSICAGEGYAGGYGKIIADMFGMTLENRGSGGATISAGTTYSGGGDRHWICRDIANMRSDADYILLEGGVNDSVNPNIGSITDGYIATLDDTTFAGAMEKMVRDALTRFAGKKIGFIAVHKMTTSYDSRGDENNRYWISKRVCEKWGMPFLDLNVSCPAFGLYNSYTAIGAALREVYTKNGDGWHPNEDGYKKYYVDKIIEFMKSL